MDRRTLLKTCGLAVLGWSVGGCATRAGSSEIGTRTGARPSINLAPVYASWDRVIRTTVGLRPHRDSGFVLKPEPFDAKSVIHNYGHGGAGMPLAWGTGAMAAELALQQPDRRLAVIGCGSVGLTAARQAQRRGFDVTIYTMTVPVGCTNPFRLMRRAQAPPRWSRRLTGSVRGLVCFAGAGRRLGGARSKLR